MLDACILRADYLSDVHPESIHKSVKKSSFHKCIVLLLNHFNALRNSEPKLCLILLPLSWFSQYIILNIIMLTTSALLYFGNNFQWL